ncbi:unnamed protein product [Urochloa humidicola]
MRANVDHASFAASSSASKRRLILELPWLLVVHYTMLAPTPVAGCMKKVNIWQPPKFATDREEFTSICRVCLFVGLGMYM